MMSTVSSPAKAAAGRIYESEGNNTFATADVTYDDYNNYGAISSATDVDYWTIRPTKTGSLNFWLGKIPSGCRYGLYVYESGISLLLAKSELSRNQQYISIHGYAGLDYTVKIVSLSGSSSAQYLFRCKTYTERSAAVFTGPDQKANSNIDFTENYDYTIPYMINMDLQTSSYYGKMAAEAYEMMPDYDLISLINHAEAGDFHFYDSHLYSGLRVYNSNNAGMGFYANDALTQIKMISFVGCHSADNFDVYGNLVDQARAKGALCSFGWTESPYHDDVLLWHDLFYGELSVGGTVGVAIAEANYWMNEYNNDLNDGIQVVLYDNIIAIRQAAATAEAVAFGG